MADHTIEIYSSGPTPTPLQMKQNQTVEFKVVDWPVVVTISFGTKSPFSQTSFQLDGGNVQLAHTTKTALSNAEGQYPYTVTPVLKETLSGEIDVSSDSPPRDK